MSLLCWSSQNWTQDTPVLFCKFSFQLGGASWLCGVVLLWMRDFTILLAKFHKASVSTFHQPVKVPLDEILEPLFAT